MAAVFLISSSAFSSSLRNTSFSCERQRGEEEEADDDDEKEEPLPDYETVTSSVAFALGSCVAQRDWTGCGDGTRAGVPLVPSTAEP